jgi:hypothetical protein
MSQGLTVAQGAVADLKVQAGLSAEGDFEEAFVRLAFPLAESRRSVTVEPSGHPMPSSER